MHGQETLLWLEVQPVQLALHNSSTQGPHAPMDPKAGMTIAKIPKIMLAAPIHCAVGEIPKLHMVCSANPEKPYKILPASAGKIHETIPNKSSCHRNQKHS